MANKASGGLSTKKHSVFVLSVDGKPLTPTTPCRARKMMRDGVATKCWSKFGTFGIKMTITVRTETPEVVTALGVDHGTKFDGYSVVCGTENIINIKLDLPNKKNVVRKLDERQHLRRAKRWRKCRRREARFDNRKRKDGWLAPSQAVVVNSRMKVMRELFRIYPINYVAFEDVCFNHAKYCWGKNFSTVEIGKALIRKFFADQGATVCEYKGYQTKEKRELYGYKKTSNKAADVFTAHCSDSLAIAVDVAVGDAIKPNENLIVVDDTYRFYRRRLHDTQPKKGDIREPFAHGTVFGLRKGLLVGDEKGRSGQLCGENKGSYRYYLLGETDKRGNKKRLTAKSLAWVSSNFITRRPVPQFPAPSKDGGTLADSRENNS